MKMNLTGKIALATVSSFALASYVIAAPGAHGGGGGFGGGNSFGSQTIGAGNSSFGQSQAASAGNPQKGSSNSAYGKSKAASAHDDDAISDNDSDLAKIKKAKKARHHTTRGNSAFGHRQGDATTRTRGSQNNAYGKARSASVKSDGDNDNDIDSDGAKRTKRVKPAKPIEND